MNYKCSQIIWLEAKLRECFKLGWDYEGQRDYLVYRLNRLMKCTHPKYGYVSPSGLMTTRYLYGDSLYAEQTHEINSMGKCVN